MNRGPVFTIGHSTHTQDRFTGLLRQHGIPALADVRSHPVSRRNPQFNRKALEQSLTLAGIQYIFLGKELGARSDDPLCYEQGRVSYERLAETASFERGIERVKDAISTGFRLALMCAEKEPVECHRTILVARRLVSDGIEVRHIHADGRLESHDDIVERLARRLRVRGADMFRSPEDVIAEAYRLQAERIAYRPVRP